MIVIEVLGWIALAFIVAIVAGLVSGTYRRQRADNHHRTAMEQLARDRDLEGKLSQLRQAAATSESPEFRALAEKLIGRGNTP